MCDAGSWSASLLGFNGSAASLSVGNTTPRTSSASYSSLASLSSSNDIEIGSSKMIQQLISLRGIGVQSATVLVREAFVRRFANGKALGSYAGLTSSPYSSGGIDREQGIGKGGNRRLRTVMVELAWLWTRYQPAAA